MPTHEEYDARRALNEEAIAMDKNAKAEFERFEHVLRAELAKAAAPPATEASGEGLSGNLLRAPMLRQMRLSGEDLTIAADACHALAERHREETERQENEVLRDAALERARHAERLAHFFERQRDRG